MKKIPLTQGQFAIIDAEDFDRVNRFKWHFHKKQNEATGYAVRYIYIGTKRTAIRMHRFILDAPRDMNVDHKNHNGIDNRKENLRQASQTQNSWNTRKRSNTSSRYKGVYWNQKKEKWQAKIRIGNNKRVYLGSFVLEEDAATAYRIASEKYHGEFSCLSSMPGSIDLSQRFYDSLGLCSSL